MNNHSLTLAGTSGGTLTIILANINSPDLIRTAVLAALGSAVSFLVTLMLKRMIGKRSRRS